MAYHVFVSYSTKDLLQVNLLKNELEQNGISVFIAEYSVVPGEILKDVIVKAINDCNLFVVIWSENSSSSDYVRQEIGVATGANKKILPIILDADDKIPAFLYGIKYIHGQDDIETSFNTATSIIVQESDQKSKSEGWLVLGAFPVFFCNVNFIREVKLF